MGSADAASITLLQYPGLRRDATLSPPCAKVHMALRFKKVPYEIRNVNAPWEVKRYNPRGRVPALLFDGTAVVDSSDILRALETRYPEPPLEPRDELERARCKVLEDWADEVLYFYGVYQRWMIPENFARMREVVLSRLPAPIRWIIPSVALRTVRRRLLGQGVGLKPESVVRSETHECFRTLATLLGQSPFVLGPSLTRADLAIASVLDQLMLEQLTPALAQELHDDPTIKPWLDRVHELAPNAARPG